MITLGTDPELVFLGPHGLINVRDVGMDRQDGHGDHNPEIGGDGHPWIVEMRPPPAEDPIEVVAHLRRIMKNNYKRMKNPTLNYNDIAWQAGSFVKNKPIGGHIHFGGIELSDYILTACDGIIGQITLLLEDSDGASKRRHGSYGQLSATRPKDWGFEYRTPASWILSPQISVGVLALGKAVIYEEVHQEKYCIKKLSGKRLDAITNINRRSFISAEKPYFFRKLKDIWGVVQRYSYFSTEEGKKHWAAVCHLKDIIDSHPHWHTDKDILHRWKIRDFTPPSYVPVPVPTETPIVPVRFNMEARGTWDFIRQGEL